MELIDKHFSDDSCGFKSGLRLAIHMTLYIAPWRPKMQRPAVGVSYRLYDHIRRLTCRI